jgi:hypothetical protein
MTSAAAAPTPPAVAAAIHEYALGHFTAAQSACDQLSTADKSTFSAQLLRAQLALSLNQFAQAEALLNQAHALQPDSLWPKKLLAQSFIRQDRMPKAAAAYLDANQLELAQQAQSFGDATPYRLEGMGEQVEIKFVRLDPLPVLWVRINGAEAYFLLDTGGPQVLIDSDFAKQLELPDFGSAQGTFAGGKKEGITYSSVKTLQLGSWILNDVPVIIKSTAAYAPAGGGLPIKGVIGTELLYHFLSTIDYPGNRLILRRPSPQASAAAALDAQRHNGAAIPFRLLWDHYMLAEGSINSAPPMQFFVDTGLAGAAFTAPQFTLDAAGITFPADKSGYQPFTAKTLTLGSVTQHDLLGLSGVFPPSLETALGARVGGLISHAFFKPYAVTFDFSAMQIYLVPASSAPATS